MNGKVCPIFTGTVCERVTDIGHTNIRTLGCHQMISSYTIQYEVPGGVLLEKRTHPSKPLATIKMFSLLEVKW